MMKKIRDDKVKEDIIEKLNINTKIKTLPAIKIGRLAIDKKFTKKGLGTHILDNILANLKDISENNIGFRFIIIEGYAKAVNFYVLKNGFINLKKDDEKIKNIDFISKRDPTKKFYLYFDLERY